MVENRYDPTALRRLHPKLEDLKELPYNDDQLRWEASGRVAKLSIQGVQPKLSARLDLKNQAFELVDQQGRFILKPQNVQFKTLPENEDLTMKLARLSGLDVPDHGLVYGQDNVLTYWIRRFDRSGRNDKIHQEDFAQLSGGNRDTKYESSLEKVAGVVQDYCAFPLVESAKLFRLVLFNFLCGNEDHHLKNFSLIEHTGAGMRLSPCYDLVNSTIVLKDPSETALSLRGKNKGLTKEDFLDYYGQQVLTLQPRLIETILQELATSLAQWPAWIESSFLWPRYQGLYKSLVRSRSERLGFKWLTVGSEELKVLEKASLQKGSGGHQNFFKKLEAQRRGSTYCLTEQQFQVIRERQTGSGGWQTAYRILGSKG
jgi:serine/threonine-protein kinase HipA